MRPCLSGSWQVGWLGALRQPPGCELLVGALGHGLLALPQSLLMSMAGEVNVLLAGVLHLPLQREEPSYLLGTADQFFWRPNQEVAILQVLILFFLGRLFALLEWSRRFPSCMFTDRRQLPALECAPLG